MAIDKAKIPGLLRLFGVKVNENALELVDNEYDAEMPDNWDELSEEDQTAWKEKHMMKENAQVSQAPKQATPPAIIQQPAPDENTIWLNSLIEGIGGREAFQALLLGAVKAVELQQNSEKSEKDTVIASLVQNSDGRLTADELKGMDLSVLKIMEKGLAPFQITDYRLQGAGVKANKEEMAVMPDIFSAETWKK